MNNLPDPHLHLEQIERQVSARCYQKMTFNVIKILLECVGLCESHMHLTLAQYNQKNAALCGADGQSCNHCPAPLWAQREDIHIPRLGVLDGDGHVNLQSHICPHRLEFKALQKTEIRAGRRPKSLREACCSVQT